MVPPSGQVKHSAPLSVEYITMVLSVEAEFLELGENLADVSVVFGHAVGVGAEAGLALRTHP